MQKKKRHHFRSTLMVYAIVLSWLWTACGGSSKESAGDQTPPPSGRKERVEEADIYRLSGNILFYLNTYKGFTVFDLKDPKKPHKVANLPVYGYPIEMYVEDQMVYALVRDALYVTGTAGKLDFHRYNVSQLLTIDISKPEQPKILQRLDIQGQLREGVSRKVGKVLYVTSYKPTTYYAGWSYQRNQGKEQLTVYSFDVRDPKAVKEIQSIQLLEGTRTFEQSSLLTQRKSKDPNDPANQSTKIDPKYIRFNGITLSATSNTLLVAERWSAPLQSSSGCGTRYDYFSKINIVDISNPSGTLRVHTRFNLRGQVNDQFKQTYIYNEKTKQALYLGIVQETRWGSQAGQPLNSFLAVDVTNGKSPKLMDELPFGKERETVRGSLFDPERKVVYAITAVQTDPMYALSFEDPNNLKVLSQIDGLSGDMSLFRFIEKRKFLLAVGRDNSSLCQGFEEPPSNQTRRRFTTKAAVSIIDVRDLSKIRLVQRKCVSVNNITGNSITPISNNLDQAHKMIGMHTGDDLNLLTIPVGYSTRSNTQNWWWYEYKTAVGVMSWDLSKYDDTKDEKQQNVLTNIATMIHPKGMVKRTVIFNMKQDKKEQRMLLNLSETYLSLMKLQDLKKPELLSSIEIAPYVQSVHIMGEYVVERITLGNYAQYYNEFRVKKLEQGKNIDDAPIVTSFSVGAIKSVVQWKQFLVLFAPNFAYLYDFTNPAQPRLRRKIPILGNMHPIYSFYLGHQAHVYRNSNGLRNWLVTDTGLVVVQGYYNANTRRTESKLHIFDFQKPDQPTQKVVDLPRPNGLSGYYLMPVDNNQFYVVARLHHRTSSGTSVSGTGQLWSYRFNRWQAGASTQFNGLPVASYKEGQFLRVVVHNPTQKNLMLFALDGGGFKATLTATQAFTDWALVEIAFSNKKLYIHKMLHNQSQLYKTNQGLRGQRFLDIFDLSKSKFQALSSGNTRTPNMNLMGIHNQKLFIQIPREGLLIVDTQQPTQPRGTHFQRTLGWSRNIIFQGNKAMVAAGHFGVYQMDLTQNNLKTKR